jgi:hypothetical protein
VQRATRQATKELSTIPKAQKCQVAPSYGQYIFIIFSDLNGVILTGFLQKEVHANRHVQVLRKSLSQPADKNNAACLQWKNVCSHASRVICAATIRNQPTEALPHLPYLPDFVPNSVKLFAPEYPPQSTGSEMW